MTITLPHELTEPVSWIGFVWPEADENKMLVRVVGIIDTVDHLHRIVQGWQDAMVGENGVEWLAERLRADGVALTATDPTGD